MAWSESVPPPADVPLAPLLRIDFKKLVVGDAVEVERLFSACKDCGFFYLDLEGDPILGDVDDQFAIGTEIFALGDDSKRAYLLEIEKVIEKGGNLFRTGYKAPGISKVDNKGNKDWIEFMNISSAEVFDDTKPLDAPDILNRKNKDLRSFIRKGHSILAVVFTCLEKSLNLPPDTLTSIHTIGKSSSTQLRITCAPPTENVTPTSLQAHTDATSLTLLFNQLSGLQILPPDVQTDDDWLWVQPLPGCAVINIGDAMSIFTNGLFQSIRHRVVRPWGCEARFKRFSVFYGLRPDDGAIMSEIGTNGKPVILEGVATAKEWGDAKFKSIASGRGFVRDPTRKEEFEKSQGKLFGY